MEFEELFSLEEKIISHGEKILSTDAYEESCWKTEYSNLLKEYKKLYKQLNRLIRINDRQQSKLSQANVILERNSKHDELTGIYNRRMFNEVLDNEWRRAIRFQLPLSLLIFDIDHFKKINDEYGHPAGDEVLKITAKKIEKVARRVGDIAARYGGEEFVLLLPHASKMGSFKIGEEIRREVSKTDFVYENQTIKVTISAGLASMVPDNETSPDVLVRRADDALYLAKRTGRNRVCIFDDVSQEGAGDA